LENVYVHVLLLKCVSDMVGLLRVFVRSFGCSSSVADGEVIAGLLGTAGFELAGSVEEADVVVFNTCAVKSPTENKIIHLLKKVPSDKRLIVTGCLPLINFPRLSCEVRFDAAVGVAFAERIVDVVKRVAKGEKVVALDGSQRKLALGLPRVRVNPVVSIVPVTCGCVGECSYCCVRFARGSLRSFSVDEVVHYVRKSLGEGASEFWFTGQDVACYGLDSDASMGIVDLLRKVCQIDDFGKFWVRLGMMTPNLLLRFVDDYAEFLSRQQENAGKVFEFLHLPVQSGDNGVLGLMNRRYCAEDFKHIVTAFKNMLPHVTVATDVIVGFPGESEDAFQRTVALIEEVKPDVVNVSKFFARPNTLAEKMKNKVDAEALCRRSGVMSHVARRISLEKNKAWVGWRGQVLVDEKGKREGSWVGRNFAYKPVVVQSEQDLLGKVLNVCVLDAFQSHLVGEVV
jgi:threonylcarbamoyladenosine tRNA methylthiotransferase CDKAL1